VGRLGEVVLKEGIYLYVGSAQGPGGLHGRILRHLKKGNVQKWHVDYLLNHCSIKSIAYIIGKGDLETLLYKTFIQYFKPAWRGFGATDKKRDYTHLFTCTYPLEECLNQLVNVGLNIIKTEKN